jgi:hypothetical protein
MDAQPSRMPREYGGRVLAIHDVTQTSSLPYRRLVVGCGWNDAQTVKQFHAFSRLRLCRLKTCDTADRRSALRGWRHNRRVRRLVCCGRTSTLPQARGLQAASMSERHRPNDCLSDLRATMKRRKRRAPAHLQMEANIKMRPYVEALGESIWRKQNVCYNGGSALD